MATIWCSGSLLLLPLMELAFFRHVCVQTCPVMFEYTVSLILIVNRKGLPGQSTNRLLHWWPGEIKKEIKKGFLFVVYVIPPQARALMVIQPEQFGRSIWVRRLQSGREGLIPSHTHTRAYRHTHTPPPPHMPQAFILLRFPCTPHCVWPAEGWSCQKHVICWKTDVPPDVFCSQLTNDV